MNILKVALLVLCGIAVCLDIMSWCISGDARDGNTKLWVMWAVTFVSVLLVLLVEVQ